MSRIIAVLLLFLYTSTIFAQSIPTSARLGVGMGKGSQSVLSGEQSTFFQNFDGETDGRDALANKSVDLAMSSADYMVTAGDVYTLSFAVGNTPVSYTIPVDSSYRVRVANLAVLDATGMSFVKLKRQVEDIVTKNYPLSAVQFVLLNPATFKVRLVGEVKSAVEMEAWALTRLSQVLGDSLTEYSSRRTITITSTSGKVKTCDLFLATRFGDLSQDPYLRPGDIITIGRADRFVTLNGAVERPGEYELLPGENFKELVEYYGNGFTDYADSTRMEVSRIYGYSAGEKKEEMFYWDDNAIEENRTLFNLDVVTVPNYTTLRSVVFIEGAIGVPESTESTRTDDSVSVVETVSNKPNGANRMVFPFVPGTSYTSFIRGQANLITPVSDTSAAYIMRNGEMIPIDVTRILYDMDYDVQLFMEAYDVLYIPFRSLKVTVSGSVKNPGQYNYVPNKTYEYYVALAGGFVMSENMGKAVEIVDGDGKRLKRKEIIQPDTVIRAKTNDFMYNFNKYAPIITTTAAVITAVITILNLTQSARP